MAFYKVHDNVPEDAVQGKAGLDAFFGNSTELIKNGGKARGLFDLAVCYSPGGWAISSVNFHDGRNYPCMCSNFPWASYSTTAESKAHAQAAKPATSHLQERSSFNWVESDSQATYNFLLGSGLYQSQDFYKYCTHSNKGKINPGNDCDEDKTVHWAWPEGKGYKDLHHPFSRCRSRPHDNPGCEAPNNNGWERNHHCNNGKVRRDYGMWADEIASEDAAAATALGL
jgi:hypothetical protein